MGPSSVRLQTENVYHNQLIYKHAATDECDSLKKKTTKINEKIIVIEHRIHSIKKYRQKQ